MKTFVKHVFCLSVITSIVMIAACTKERNKTGQVSDFRDSLVGGYSCDRYTLASHGHGPPGSTDSVYWTETLDGHDTINVVKAISDSAIIVNGFTFSSPIRHDDTIIMYSDALNFSNVTLKPNGDSIHYSYGNPVGHFGDFTSTIYTGHKIR